MGEWIGEVGVGTGVVCGDGIAGGVGVLEMKMGEECVLGGDGAGCVRGVCFPFVSLACEEQGKGVFSADGCEGIFKKLKGCACCYSGSGAYKRSGYDGKKLVE